METLYAFIVRPFGVKQDIDFDRVERELIKPALKAVGIIGKTTGEIAEAGNIRSDMFSELLTADFVIADISIHNANVFYELGVRHALRDKKTYLIRCNKDEVPFDIKTDRYLSYDAAKPAECLSNLISGLQATALSDRQDSPVFYMLPKLEAQEVERFLAVPPDFAEEVEIAKDSKQKGRLALLAAEAETFSWLIPALRVIGEVQFYLKDFEDARVTWEKIRSRYPNDQEANDLLSTIYQRLAEPEMHDNLVCALELLSQSDLAIKRLLNQYNKIDKNKRAEIYSLRARNSKTKWINSWSDSPEKERGAAALQSPYLFDAYYDYERGYNEDLNHYYSGINALGLLAVIIALADSMPEIWELEFDTKEEADLALNNYKEQYKKLSVSVNFSIDAATRRLKKEDKTDPWLSITEADLKCLILQKPGRVKNLYSKVLKFAGDLNFEAAQRQLQVYQKLNVVPENVKAALAAFAEPIDGSSAANKKHYILFTGHMIDKSDRKEPRFPREKEENAKKAIKEAVQKEKDKIKGEVTGIAGGACGGDILFHEACKELGIKTELFLALPRDQFLVESVAFAGPQWIERFNTLIDELPEHVLSQSKELPKWLQKNPNYSIWERANLWMLNTALTSGGSNLTLIALWDLKGGDGSGGTQHMVQQAEARGAKVIKIDIKEIKPFVQNNKPVALANISLQ